MLIDNYAYLNKLKDVHPAEKLLFALATMAVGFIPNALLNLAIVLMMGTVLVFKAGIPARIFLKMLLIPFSFIIIGMLTMMVNVIPAGSNALIKLSLPDFNVGITLESMKMSGLLFSRSMAMVSCLYFLAFTTPVMDIVAVLRSMKVPVLLLELMELIYRFLFVLMETSEKIYISQASRLGYINAKTSVHSLGRLASSLLVKSWRDSESLYISLEARGYDGELRVLTRSFPISQRNIFFIVLAEFLLLILAWLFRG
ncbi:MAG: cobalt ECF transporter T component CbiQ [Tepidanaerobacteraceae bacterium]|jgi:cobalt/nickel transport system permease protein|nr:cobalt ECF transporter T component CbiQ [Tepidanaerobacteraceae bacterium]